MKEDTEHVECSSDLNILHVTRSVSTQEESVLQSAQFELTLSCFAFHTFRKKLFSILNKIIISAENIKLSMNRLRSDHLEDAHMTKLSWALSTFYSQ